MLKYTLHSLSSQKQASLAGMGIWVLDKTQEQRRGQRTDEGGRGGAESLMWHKVI